jgi:5-methylcytosine-specific restriction endonuclease McrA
MPNKRMYGVYKSETTVVDGVVLRRCVYCGEVKPLVEFPHNGTDASGEECYRQDCKTCYNIRRRENKNKKAHADFIGGQKRRGEAAPSLSHQEWKEIMIFFGGECAYCGCTPKRNQRLTKDHLQPISVGGKTTADNIVPACSACNCSKGAEEFKDWFMKQSFFSQERMNKIFKWRSIMRQLKGGD